MQNGPASVRESRPVRHATESAGAAAPTYHPYRLPPTAHALPPPLHPHPPGAVAVRPWSVRVDLDEAVRGLIGEALAHQRERDVVDGSTVAEVTFQRAVVRVPVEDGVHLVARERLLEASAAEVREDLERLALHRRADRRVVEHRDLARRAQARERALELERLVHRFLHER